MIKFYKTDNMVSRQGGYSLLELLVVVGILASISFIAVGNYVGVIEQTNDTLVRSEMQEIAGAIKRFKDDTGYYPGTGPFGLASGSSPGTIAVPSGGTAWFISPANFNQLFIEPTTDNKPPEIDYSNCVMKWNPETGRGWRGSYISYDEGFVDIGDDINGDANGNPRSGSTVDDVNGIADPFHAPAVVVGSDTLFDWVSNTGASDERESGRPYLFFIDSGLSPGSICPGKSPVLISMGLNGNYDQGSSDDLKICL